jgi:hypothetical protein
MKLVTLALAAALAATPVWAANHLEPENSVLGGEFQFQLNYDAMVATVLKEAFAQGVMARMTAEPSFDNEYAVALRQDGDAWTILHLRPKVQLWSYPTLGFMESGQERVLAKDGTERRDDEGIARLRASIPADWHNVPVERCAIAIDAGLAGRILDVWTLMLAATRYPQESIPRLASARNSSETVTIHADGETYHFARTGDPDLAGQTWSPDPGTQPGQLVAIASLIAKYCHTKKAYDAAELSTAVDRLLAQLHTPDK